MKRINGITYLKAFLPFLVIAWHVRFLGLSGIMQVQEVYIPSIADVVYINIVNLAVPIFFLISFYLYLIKRKSSGDNYKYLIKRIINLFEIFVIWRAIYVIFGIGNLWIPSRGIIINLYHLLFGGGDTLLYYILLLIYFLITIEIIISVCERLKWRVKAVAVIGLTFSLVVLLICYFIPEYLKYEALRYFSPIAFIPLVFIAILIVENKTIINIKFALTLFAIGVALAVIEWILIPDSKYISQGVYAVALPIYSRLSQIVIASAIFILMLNIKKEPSKIVLLLSNVSLYAYCVHQIIITELSKRFEIQSFISFLITIVITYFCSIVLFFLKRIIVNNHRKVLEDNNERRTFKKN